MAEKVAIDEDFTEKLSDWDESDVGKRIAKRVTPNGTYFNELVVQVFCQFCALNSSDQQEKQVDFWEVTNVSTHGKYHKPSAVRTVWWSRWQSRIQLVISGLYPLVLPTCAYRVRSKNNLLRC